MKSIVLREPGQFMLEEAEPPPHPGLDEVQVRVLRVGICGTDLHAFTGTQPFFSYPRILGHELAVEILEIGDTSGDHALKRGDVGCIRPYLHCGVCIACRRGHENCCVRMQVLGVHRDGGMREILNVPMANVHTSSMLSADELALVETLSIGCHAVRRAQLIPGEVVLVVGMGPIGLGVAQFAHLAGARVVAADINGTRRAFAGQSESIEQCIDARADVFGQLHDIIGEDLPTAVFDATGNAQSMMKSFEFVAHGGRLIFVGLFQGNITFSDPEFHKRELSVLASRNATAQDFHQVIAALESHTVDVKPWITHRASPEQMPEAFPSWLDMSNGVVKAMLNF